MTLERIEITPFVTTAGEILRQRRSGALTVVRPPLRRVVYWAHGEVVLVTSAAPEDSLGQFLVRRGVLSADRALQLHARDPTETATKFHEAGLADLSSRQTFLREWMTQLILPLFSLDEGTTAFEESEPLDPDKRVFIRSTAALIVDGARSITNGLVLRRSLGDLDREIVLARDSRVDIEALPLTEGERRIAASLREPQSIERFLKSFPGDSAAIAKVVIAMLAIGVFVLAEEMRGQRIPATFDDTQRDLEVMATIGAGDPRSLRAYALARQMQQFDHYQFLDVPRAASRAQILAAAENMRELYKPETYPPIVRDAVEAINRRLDEALNVFKETTKRTSYDRLLHQTAGSSGAAVEQRLQQRSIAEHNFARARDLSAEGDYYGAILLLKQAVEFAPDHAEAWHLLGACQERNPKWRRDAVESFQRALAADPNLVEALISLGDLYREQGLVSRAQTCYEDALRITPDDVQAKTRLTALKKR